MSGSKGLTDTCGCERLSPPGALETVEYTGVVLHCSVAVVFWRASSVWSEVSVVCSHSVTVTASVDSRATVDRARRRTLCTTRGVGRHVEHVTNSVGRTDADVTWSSMYGTHSVLHYRRFERFRARTRFTDCITLDFAL